MAALNLRLRGFDTYTTLITLSVRAASGSPALLIRPLAEAIGEVDSRLALTFRPFEDQLNASLTQERTVAMLAAFFGGLALLLSGSVSTA